MKEKLIMFALGAAWAAGTAVVTFVLGLNNNQIVIISDIKYNKERIDHNEKQIANCVEKSLYQVEKQLLMEKFKK